MSEVTKLSVIGGQAIPDAKAEMLKRFDEDVAAMRKWLEESGKGGYAVLAYDRDYKDSTPQVHTWCNTFCYDPGDNFWLPDAAKTRIHERVHGD